LREKGGAGRDPDSGRRKGKGLGILVTTIRGNVTLTYPVLDAKKRDKESLQEGKEQRHFFPTGGTTN